jgi:cytochrome c oxidase subunit IV
MDNTQALKAQDLPPEEQKTSTKDPVVKTLIKVFWVLLIVTIVEVALALVHYATHFPPRPILNALFIGLTIVKAFYIVGEFMHLKHELKNLIWMILIPLIFLFWGIVALLYEGSTTKTARQDRRGVTTESTVPWENVKHETH